MWYDGVNRAVVQTFGVVAQSGVQVAEFVTYHHSIANTNDSIQGLFVERLPEPIAPGPITEFSAIAIDFSVYPAKLDTVTRPNGDAYVVTEFTADESGMIHFQLRKT